MKALVIAEKPSVAMALASVLGARTRKDGYVEGNGYIVSWCVGHRLFYALFTKLLLKYSARVLKTSVRMKNRSGIRIIFESLIVCVKHKFIVIPSAYNIRNWKSII